MPTITPIRAVTDCPVVGHPVLLSRDRVFLDYILMRETEPTCSNIHNCFRQYGELKNIKDCLLHNASKYLPSQGGPQQLEVAFSVMRLGRRATGGCLVLHSPPLRLWNPFDVAVQGGVCNAILF
jgi:hypothetical protein